MSRVITFSMTYPSYHPKKGQPTYFVEKIWNSFNVEALDQTFLADFEDDIKFNLNKKLHISHLHNFLFTTHGHRREELGAKFHTIRAGKRWKKGDYFSPAVWGNDINPKSGRSGPYHSKQIKIAPDIGIKKVWDFEIRDYEILVNGKQIYHQYKSMWHDNIEELAKNDGLTCHDLYSWFKMPCSFQGQIICWNENIYY